jgi:rod shape-determining protein MreD
VSVYLAVPLLLVAAIVQSSAVPHVTVWGVFPDVVLVLVVTWGLEAGRREGVVWGLIGGLGVDLLSGAPMGAATVSMAAVGFLAGTARRSAFRGRAALPSLAAFVGTVVYDLLFLAIVALSGGRVLWLASLGRIVLPAALLNGVLAWPVARLARGAHRRLAGEEGVAL